MQRRAFLLIASAAGLAGGRAWAQTSIRPDPTPRLPPQPGQGLPVDDRRFLREAGTLSAAQAEAASRAAQATTNEETRRFATALAERHRGLAEQLSSLTRQRGGPEAAQTAAAAPGPKVARALQRLAGLGQTAAPGGSDPGREFLAAQLEVHPVLVEMYQAEASQTTDRELGRIAITALVGLQEDFATAARLGEGYGLARPEGLLANPPQYGPGTGPAR